MQDIKVSIDRIIIEYTKVSLEFFNTYVARTLCDFYHTNLNPNGSPAFHYTVCFKENDGQYLHLSYKPMREKKSIHYTLWAETNPEYMGTFKNVFKILSQNSRDINFVLCDVAYDIPVAINKVLLVSKTGRKATNYKGTIYYGEGSDRRTHGYLRCYDKKKQLKEVRDIDVLGDLTRVEIVYRPSATNRFAMKELLARSPDFNRLYQCYVLTDIKKLNPKREAIIKALISHKIIYKELSSYQRGVLKKDLTSQMKVDFDTLAQQQWKELVSIYISIACGW